MSKPIKRDFGDRTIPTWVTGPGGQSFTDIKYEIGDGIAKITINRPEVRNAFRPQTIIELKAAEAIAEEHELQLINYLKATEIEVGLLLNFGKKPEFKRKVFSNTTK